MNVTKPLSTDVRFADLIAEGATVSEAAVKLGISHTYGNAVMQRIRRKLGAQAI